MSNKICFIDIDGPLLPIRAYHLPGQTQLVTKFDPCAVSLVNKLIEDSGAKIVISSTWAQNGLEKCQELFIDNHIPAYHFHEDWMTPRKFTSARTSEIRWWLEDHPEITNYVAIDDEQLDSELLPGFVQCDAYEGFSYRNYCEARLLLGVASKEETELILYLKRKEIWRTHRIGEKNEHLTHIFADKVFPVTKKKNSLTHF